MKTVTIDCARHDRLSLHRLLKEKLDFPDWYGDNLDALYDCLCETPPVHLVVKDLPPLPGFRETITDAAKDNPDLKVTFL